MPRKESELEAPDLNGALLDARYLGGDTDSDSEPEAAEASSGGWLPSVSLTSAVGRLAFWTSGRASTGEYDFYNYDYKESSHESRNYLLSELIRQAKKMLWFPDKRPTTGSFCMVPYTDYPHGPYIFSSVNPQEIQDKNTRVKQNDDKNYGWPLIMQLEAIDTKTIELETVSCDAISEAITAIRDFLLSKGWMKSVAGVGQLDGEAQPFKVRFAIALINIIKDELRQQQVDIVEYNLPTADNYINNYAGFVKASVKEFEVFTEQQFGYKPPSKSFFSLGS